MLPLDSGSLWGFAAGLLLALVAASLPCVFVLLVRSCCWFGYCWFCPRCYFCVLVLAFGCVAAAGWLCFLRLAGYSSCCLLIGFLLVGCCCCSQLGSAPGLFAAFLCGYAVAVLSLLCLLLRLLLPSTWLYCCVVFGCWGLCFSGGG